MIACTKPSRLQVAYAKAAMKESKLLEKQSKKQTRARKSKCTGSMPDVTTDKLTLDEATDGLPVDAAADNTVEESTCTCNNKDSSSKSQLIQHHLMQRDKNTLLMMKSMLTGDMCMLMMLKPGKSGQNVGAQGEYMMTGTDDDEFDTEQCSIVHFVKTLILL